MTATCLNPDCKRQMAAIGVCVICSNGTYNPSKHGVGGVGYDYNTGGGV